MAIDKEFHATTGMITMMWQWCGGHNIRRSYENAVDNLVQEMTPWRLPDAIGDDILQARRLICVSDLHIGTGDKKPQDNFSLEKTRAFEQFLDEYGSSDDTAIIYLGDIIEAWRSDGAKVVKNRQALLDKMSANSHVYLLGNHDRWYSSGISCRESISSHPFFDNMTEQFVLTVGNKRILFMHGHEIDPYNQEKEPSSAQAALLTAEKHPPVSGNNNTIFAVAKKVIRACFGWVTHIRLETGHDLTSSCDTDNLYSYHLHNTALLKEKLKGTDNEFDFVVMGHSHIPEQRSWYHNTGAWAEGITTFLEIDKSSSDPKFTLFEWRDGKAHFIES